ncbi:MAG: hypothetical protein D6730_11210 [Bacteroidetes bacterium]|nr:MAG: hypothetical protein D6730_11210 [Bacteroidota bacterium]
MPTAHFRISAQKKTFCLLCACCLLAGMLLHCTSDQHSGTSHSTGFQPVQLQAFPQVTQTAARSLEIHAYSLHFRLSYPDGIKPYANAQLPWMNNARLDEASGDIITFLRSNDALRLDKPHIRVSYIRKQAEQPNVHALLQWLKNTFVAGQHAQVRREASPLQTASGTTAQFMELYLPQHPGGRSQRYLAFAYLDPGQDYMLGFQLSAVSQADYDSLLNAFYEVVKSYESLAR